MPPPSSGGIVLVEMLNILEGYDIAGDGFGSGLNVGQGLRSIDFRLPFPQQVEIRTVEDQDGGGHFGRLPRFHSRAEGVIARGRKGAMPSAG